MNELPVELLCNVVFFMPMREIPPLFSLSQSINAILLSNEADEYYWANKCRNDFSQTQKLKPTWRLTYKKCLSSRWFNSINPANSCWANVFKSTECWAMKIVLVGYTGSGKTSLTQRVIRNEFDPNVESTIGAAFSAFTVDNSEYPQHKLKFEIWDTSGVDRYSSLLPMYHRSAVFVILTFDITSQQSFDRIQGYIDSLKSERSATKIWLVGTKTDLQSERVISPEQGQEMKRKNSDIVIKYKECSAKDSVNAHELFSEIFVETVKYHRWLQRSDRLPVYPTPIAVQLGGPVHPQSKKPYKSYLNKHKHSYNMDFPLLPHELQQLKQASVQKQTTLFASPSSTTTEDNMNRLTDCYYFLNHSCTKGDNCEYRHCEATLSNTRVCRYWLQNQCDSKDCAFRHPKLKSDPKKTVCYFFSIGKCTKGANCEFLHETVQNNSSVTAATTITKQQTVTVQPVQSPKKLEQKTKPVQQVKKKETKAIEQPVSMKPKPVQKQTKKPVDKKSLASVEKKSVKPVVVKKLPEKQQKETSTEKIVEATVVIRSDSPVESTDCQRKRRKIKRTFVTGTEDNVTQKVTPELIIKKSVEQKPVEQPKQKKQEVLKPLANSPKTLPVAKTTQISGIKRAREDHNEPVSESKKLKTETTPKTIHVNNSTTRPATTTTRSSLDDFDAELDELERMLE